MHRLLAEERQFREERDQHGENRHRLGKRMELLQIQLQETSDENTKKELQEEILITEIKKELANAKYEKADKLWRQRYFEQRQVWGAATADQYVVQWKEKAEEWDKKIKMSEEHLKKLEIAKEQYIDDSAESKRLLEEALKDGYVEVVIIVCIVLGLPGVGKTHLKFLLLDQRPPHLRTSTICAETPIRIEIRTITGTRVQTVEGKWSEIDGEDMFDVVAEMILLAEPESSSEIHPHVTDDSSVAAAQKPKKKSVFTRLISRLKKRSTSVEHLEATDSTQASASALPQASDSSACEKAMNVIMNKLTQHITKMKGKIYEGKESLLLCKQRLKSKWVYFTDSGGQPQYHELLPLFMRRISSALCVIRLPDRLNEIQSVEYFKDGKPIGAAQYSQFTSLDTIKCLVNTIQSYANQDNPPKIILVGTHLDKLEEQPKHDTEGLAANSHETLEDKDRQLIEILERDFSDQLVYYSESSKEKRLLFTLNTLNPGEHENIAAQSIRRSVEASGTKGIKIPIWWYILELMLQELSKELGRGVLSRTECLEMVHLLGIEEDSFNAALVYFDELNIIKYSPDILPDVVFIDSQIPLDKVSELVHHSYLLRQPTSSLDAEWRHFRDQGVVSKECLKMFDCHYVPGIFSESHLAQYLKQLLVLAPIPRPEWAPCSKQLQQSDAGKAESDETHFVMPTLLPTLSEGDLEKWRIFSPVAAPLLIKFPKGSRRAGVFCCFIIHLIRHCNWKFLLNKEEKLYRNCVRMHDIIDSPPMSVVLIDSNSYIEVHVNATTGIPVSEYTSLLPTIKQTILSGIFTACRALKYDLTKPEFAFYCPHTTPSEKATKVTISSTVSSSQPAETQHTASLTADRKYWKCDLDTAGTYFGPLEEQKHTIWLGKPKDSCVRSKTSAKCGEFSHPTPSNLELIKWKNERGKRKKFHLKNETCHKWERLGNLLEIPLPILKSMEQQYRGDASVSMTAVFEYWILERPSELYPLTWEGLDRLLNDAELGQVAEDLKQALNNHL